MRPQQRPLEPSALLPSTRLRLWVATMIAALVLLLAPTSAQAGPPTSGGASGSASTNKANEGYELPDFVYGGNAVSLLAPVQVGLVGYVPRGRIGVQYDRQLYRPHWVHIGVAALFDRGRYDDFKTTCGLDDVIGACDPGTVAGMDVWLGYTYKLYIESAPYLVPYFRGGLAGGFWKYPRIGASREQIRELSWTLALQAGAGVRLFLLRELAIGLDIEFRPGLVIHRDRPPGEEIDKDPGFLLPLQILPLIVEWRF